MTDVVIYPPTSTGKVCISMSQGVDVGREFKYTICKHLTTVSRQTCFMDYVVAEFVVHEHIHTAGM